MTSLELMEITGVTLRRLQWWAEQDVIVPQIEGHTRSYSFSQAFEVALVVALRRKGLPLVACRRVLIGLRSAQKSCHRIGVDFIFQYLLTTVRADQCHFYLMPNGVLEKMRQANEPFVLIDVSFLPPQLVRQVRNIVPPSGTDIQ